MATLLANRYACVGSSPNASWNELHDAASGKVLDYKKGPNDAVDPSDTVAHPTGSYKINGAGTSTTVTYTYGSGTYSYTIKAALGTHVPDPGTYSFCSSGGGQNLTVRISATHC